LLKTVNLKEENFNVELALAVVEIEIECAKREGRAALKLLHGYGSHGRGGVIAIEVRKALFHWKKSGFITDYFGGDRWNMFEKCSQRILLKDKDIYADEDMGRANPGITIVEI
jgi:hypothetical protein